MNSIYDAALIGSLAILAVMLAFALGWFIRGWQMQVQMEKSLDAQLALANDLRFVRSELDECRDQFSDLSIMAGSPPKQVIKNAVAHRNSDRNGGPLEAPKKAAPKKAKVKK